MTDVVRFIKLTDCAPLAKIFQEQVRRYCGIFAVFIMRLWISVKRSVLAGFLRHSFDRGGGASSLLLWVGAKIWGPHAACTNTSLRDCVAKWRGKSRLSAGPSQIPHFWGWETWCHLARLGVRAPLFAAAGMVGVGHFVL